MSATQFLQRACPVCHATESRPHLIKGEMHLVKCARCQMVFANPIPSHFATGDFYNEAGDYYLSEPKLQSDYAPVRFDRELRLVRRHVKKGRVLDVGCSTGAFLYQLRDRFGSDYVIAGTDVAGPALDYADSKNIPVIRGNFLNLTFTEPFDAVTFWAVLEHLPNPGSFLQKAATLLKTDGFCFVLVPNYRSLATRLLGARYRYILPEHLNYFTASTLTSLLGEQFEIIEVRGAHFNPLVIAQDFRARNVRVEDRSALLKKTTALKQNRLLALARIPYRLTELALSKMGLADNLVVVAKPRRRHF